MADWPGIEGRCYISVDDDSGGHPSGSKELFYADTFSTPENANSYKKIFENESSHLNSKNWTIHELTVGPAIIP
jgi:hypothetical protein